jgi:hypothetical protein
MKNLEKSHNKGYGASPLENGEEVKAKGISIFQ